MPEGKPRHPAEKDPGASGSWRLVIVVVLPNAPQDADEPPMDGGLTFPDHDRDLPQAQPRGKVQEHQVPMGGSQLSKGRHALACRHPVAGSPIQAYPHQSASTAGTSARRASLQPHGGMERARGGEGGGHVPNWQLLCDGTRRRTPSMTRRSHQRRAQCCHSPPRSRK